MNRQQSVKDLMRNFFRAHVGEVINGEQLRDLAAPRTEWARRVRELREREGWAIQTHIDNANLRPGQYLLTEIPPEEGQYEFAPGISTRLRAQVLARNGHTCQKCGAAAGDPDPEYPGRTTRLHVGHIVDIAHGGSNELSNLQAECSVCNQGARNLAPEPPSRIWLMSQIRRATIADQEHALEWLQNKFQNRH